MIVINTLRDGREIRHRLPLQGSVEISNEQLTLGKNAGSFSIDTVTGLPRKYTPVDDKTGIAYPIVSDRPLPSIGHTLNRKGVVIADWNHNYHPKEQLVHGTLGQMALRNIRVQWVHRDDHTAYHKEFYGPDFAALGDLLRPIVFGAAGFVPEFGLQYDGRAEAHIVRLNKDERVELWKSGKVKIYNHMVVRDALIALVVKNDFNDVSKSNISEFLETKNDRRKVQLGSNFLNMAIHEVANPLNYLYSQAWHSDSLPPNAPRSADKCVKRLVTGCAANRRRALRALEDRLRVAA